MERGGGRNLPATLSVVTLLEGDENFKAKIFVDQTFFVGFVGTTENTRLISKSNVPEYNNVVFFLMFLCCRPIRNNRIFQGMNLPILALLLLRQRMVNILIGFCHHHLNPWILIFVPSSLICKSSFSVLIKSSTFSSNLNRY